MHFQGGAEWGLRGELKSRACYSNAGAERELYSLGHGRHRPSNVTHQMIYLDPRN
jgi:hypothetical protein